ncbi:MAG: hypothetical protein HIU57_04440 [Acidobacteria bacterium]|nr:hypothetical protein [Acidobacteriota bacterium]
MAAATMAADVDGVIIGRISIRFALNDLHLTRGGHIGHAVRPGFRRRAHASEILRQGLIIANARGTDPAVVTYDDAHIASATAIEREVDDSRRSTSATMARGLVVTGYRATAESHRGVEDPAPRRWNQPR